MRKILFALSLSFFTLGVHAGDIYVKENGSVAEALKQARSLYVRIQFGRN